MDETVRVGATEFSRPSDTELVATRVIDAPRELVWAAHTQCQHVRRWLLGPEGWTMPVCEIDLRPGGRYRYACEGPGGPRVELGGEYREVQAPERVVNTEAMDGAPEATLNELTLTEAGGQTLLRTVVRYPSRELREQIIATGMMDGWAASYDRLEEYLRGLRWDGAGVDPPSRYSYMFRRTSTGCAQPCAFE